MTSAFVFAADRGYELPLAVAAASLTEHTGAVRILVLDGGLLPEARESITHFLRDRAEITWLAVDDEQLRGTQASGPSRLPVTTNYRLLLPELAPEVTRAVYLDADTVITASMAELLEIELGEAWLAAVPDSGAPYAAGPAGPDWRELGLAADTRYYNAGVVVLPLSVWRAQGLGEQALKLLRERAPRWGDQDALNVVCQGHILELPRRYNLQLGDVTGRSLNWALWPQQVQAAVDEPALVHFNGPVKPWQHGCTHPLKDRWWQALERTPWRDWEIPRPQRVRTLVRKATAAVRKELA